MEHSTWNTSDELLYLDGLGTHTDKRMDRRELLEAYLKVLPLRPKSERYLDMDKLRRRVEELLADDGSVAH